MWVLRSVQGLLTRFCLVRIQSIDSEVHGTENSAIAHQTWPSLEGKTHLLWHSVVLPVQYLIRWDNRVIYILIDLTESQEGDSLHVSCDIFLCLIRWDNRVIYILIDLTVSQEGDSLSCDVFFFWCCYFKVALLLLWNINTTLYLGNLRVTFCLCFKTNLPSGLIAGCTKRVFVQNHSYGNVNRLCKSNSFSYERICTNRGLQKVKMAYCIIQNCPIIAEFSKI